MKATLSDQLYCECGNAMVRNLIYEGDKIRQVYMCGNGECPEYRVKYLPPKFELEKFEDKIA